MGQGDWVSHRTTLVAFGFQPQYLNISGGRLSFTGSSFAGAFEGAFVKRQATLKTGGLRVTAQVRSPNGVTAYMLICGATDWSSYAMVGVRNIGVDICSGTGWTVFTTQESELATIIDGDFISIDWISGDDRYDVYRHTGLEVPEGAVPIASWRDAGHVVQHGAAYQYSGAMLTISAWTPSASFENFGFRDIIATTPPVIIEPGSGHPPYSVPFRLPITEGIVPSVPMAILDLFSPAPGVPETVTAPLAILDLMTPAPALDSDPVMAPLAVLDLTAAAPSAVVAPSQFVDPFDDLSAWTLSGYQASLMITATGRLNLTAPVTTTGAITATMNNYYDIAGKAGVEIEVVAHGSGNHIDYFRVTDASGSAFSGFMFYFGTLYATNTAANIWSATFNAVTHRYLRIRESSGTIYYEYSADGVSWTTATTSTGTTFNATAARAVIIYQANAGADSTFDNLVVF